MKRLLERIENLAVVLRLGIEKTNVACGGIQPDCEELMGKNMNDFTLDEMEGLVADILNVQYDEETTGKMRRHEYLEFSSVAEFNKFRGLAPISLTEAWTTDINELVNKLQMAP